MSAPEDWLRPDWPVPATVHACVTTRHGGVSTGPFTSMNPASHVGDDPAAVTANRQWLAEALALPAAPVWLDQVHGRTVADAATASGTPEADAAIAERSGVVCAVLTADCLPVLFCARDGTRVGAAHAGWRGLAGGVLEATVARLGGGAGLMAWLGPAIGPAAFEVGDEVRAAFVDDDAGAAAAFRPSPAGRWLADIYGLARRRLAACGVEDVYGGGLCTWTDAGRFYSYRRDGTTGRMASLVWLSSGPPR